MMALDGKTIIKEEITEKDAYDATTAASVNRRNKAITSSTTPSISKDTNHATHSNGSNSSSSASNPNGNGASRSCRTPDSPESARAIAPRSPMSPQVHHSSLAPPLTRPNRNASASPVVNGATTTPPPPSQSSQAAAAAAVAAAHVEQARLLGKIRKFLGSLVQLSQDVHPEVSDRVRALVISLASGGISIEEFRLALQDAINLPLRPYVIPLLKNHISLLQREIAALSRATNQTTLQYVTMNENAVMEFATHGPPPEYSDIFVQLDTTAQISNGGGGGGGGGAANLVFKRRSSDTLIEHHNGVQDWSDYMAATYPPPAKRLHPAHNPHLSIPPPTDARLAFAAQPTLFDYSTAAAGSMAQSEGGFGSLMEKANHRDEREMRVSNQTNEAQRLAARSNISAASVGGGGGGGAVAGGEEEWKNIHTMLNCISAMVDKTKRAITILQQRGVDPQQPNYGEVTPATLVEIRRQTEEKVAEFKRSAEDAVSQVKRQAVIEIQRAVVAAETRAAEVMAQERLRMEKFFVEMSRHAGNGPECETDNKSPSITTAAASQNACWNCGRKATETCSGCNLARYCGAFCQHKDWEHHHQICGTSRSTDLTTKHAAAAAAAAASQVIPLTASMRGSAAAAAAVLANRSPPTQSSQSSTQQSAQLSSSSSGGGGGGGGSSATQQPNALIPNGIGSK